MDWNARARECGSADEGRMKRVKRMRSYVYTYGIEHGSTRVRACVGVDYGID